MALSRRGKIVLGIVGVLAVALLGIGVLALTTGKDPIEIVKNPGAIVAADPVTCPLNGVEAPGGQIPDRPVVAVKVENTDLARPQVGIEDADIVYEEVVEGGITRWIVMYQCALSKQVGPVRSARLTDPEVLLQYGKPVLAYSGGANKVQKAVNRSGLIAFDETTGGAAFTRDASRQAPHDLVVNTQKLLKSAKKAKKEGAPEPAFTYVPAQDWQQQSKKAGRIDLTFSDLNQVTWEYKNVDGGAWWRSDNGSPNVLDGGDQIGAQNVIVQFVKVNSGDIQDVTGSPSPEVTLTGKGKAYLFRNGRVVAGTWSRPSLKDPTVFEARGGGEFELEPGQTWIELYPAKGDFTKGSFEYSKK